MRIITFIAQPLIIFGDLNWGLVGLFEFDLVSVAFGSPEVLPARILYALVGIAGIYGIYLLRSRSRVAKLAATTS